MKKFLLIYLMLLPLGIFAQTQGQTLYVIKPCNMYSSASVKSEPVHLLNYNKVLTVRPAGKGWFYAEHTDKEGVKHTGYVQKANLTADREQAKNALQQSMME